MLKPGYLFNLFLGCLCLLLFVQCNKSEQNNISKPLVTIEIVTKDVVSQRLDIKYKDDKIIQVGNSSFSYDAQGRVDREIFTIGSNNPDYLSGSESTNVTFQYRWDTKNRLTSVEHIETTGSPLPSVHPYFLYSFPVPSKKYSYMGNSTVLDKIELFNKDGKWVETTKFYHKGEILDSIVIQQLRSNAGRWIPLNDYDYWNGGNEQYPNPYDYLRDYMDENNGGLAYYIQNTIYRSPKTQQPNPLEPVFKSLGFVPRGIDLQWQNDVLLPYVIEQYGTLDIMFHGNSSLVDSLAPYYMDASMKIQYATNNQGTLEYIKFPAVTRWGINVGATEYRFVY